MLSNMLPFVFIDWAAFLFSETKSDFVRVTCELAWRSLGLWRRGRAMALRTYGSDTLNGAYSSDCISRLDVELCLHNR